MEAQRAATDERPHRHFRWDAAHEDPPITHPQDANRIDIHDANEVRNWTKALGCTETELKQAVAAVGTYADKVRQYLGQS